MSKQKQKLYIKFLKNKSTQNEYIYKNYKHFFEKLRKKGKQTYHQSILKDCKRFENAFMSVKHNKAAGHDDIDSNAIVKVYDKISYPLFMIFHLMRAFFQSS